MFWFLIAASMLQPSADPLVLKVGVSAERHYDCVEPLFNRQVEINTTAQCRLNDNGRASQCELSNAGSLSADEKTAAVCLAEGNIYGRRSGRSPAGVRVEVPVHLRHNLD